MLRLPPRGRLTIARKSDLKNLQLKKVKNRFHMIFSPTRALRCCFSGDIFFSIVSIQYLTQKELKNSTDKIIFISIIEKNVYLLSK